MDLKEYSGNNNHVLRRSLFILVFLALVMTIPYEIRANGNSVNANDEKTEDLMTEQANLGETNEAIYKLQRIR